jgi:hypothetical protein
MRVRSSVHSFNDMNHSASGLRSTSHKGWDWEIGAGSVFSSRDSEKPEEVETVESRGWRAVCGAHRSVNARADFQSALSAWLLDAKYRYLILIWMGIWVSNVRNFDENDIFR